MPKHGRQQILATLQSLYRSELKSSANSTRSTGPWACAMGSAEVGLQKHRSLLKSWFTSPKCAPPHSMGTGGASIHRPRCITGRNFCDTRATHTPSAVTTDPCHTSYSGISMIIERTFSPAGFAIGIVTVLDQKLFIIFNLHVTLDWLQKLDGRRREGVVAKSDRRVDDARVGGHRLGRWRRLIHDDTTGISGGKFVVSLRAFIWS